MGHTSGNLHFPVENAGGIRGPLQGGAAANDGMSGPKMDEGEAERGRGSGRESLPRPRSYPGGRDAGAGRPDGIEGYLGAQSAEAVGVQPPR